MKTCCPLKIGISRFALVSLLAIAPLSAFAVPITFEFSGYGNCGAHDPCTDVIGDDLTVSGSFTFDSEAIDQRPADDTEGLYISTGGVFGINYRFGLLHGESDSVRIWVQDYGDWDIYSVSSGDDGIVLNMYSYSGGFDSDGLPLVPPDLTLFDDFHEADLTMRFDEYPFATFGFMDSFTVGVAEPGVYVLWGFGVAILLLNGHLTTLRRSA